MQRKVTVFFNSVDLKYDTPRKQTAVLMWAFLYDPSHLSFHLVLGSTKSLLRFKFGTIRKKKKRPKKIIRDKVLGIKLDLGESLE